MEFLTDFGLFLAKAVTVVVASGAIIAFIAAAARSRSGGTRERLEVRPLNEHYRSLGQRVERALARGRLANRRLARTERQRRRTENRSQARLPRLFVLDFQGDLRASATDSLREEISAVLTSARDGDEVLLRLESPGGLVPHYGLAASQLVRLRSRGLRLTVAVDRVAASGGYLMAAVADRIIAAPFAVVGSIGVVAQLPNLNRLLKRHDVDYELHTAGENKRTLTVFGENTDAGRAKLREDLNATHELFKAHIARYRPRVDMASVATGEHWLAERAHELDLVDDLQTSDDFLLEQRERMELAGLRWRRRPELTRRLSLLLEKLLTRQ